jgi:serine/threonine protein kinase
MLDGSPTDNLPGQQLDEYRLEALLGQGGMACVYRGFDVRLKRPVAIKVINPPFRTDLDYVVRFEREAQAIAQLKHPHIVGVYRYGEANNLLYMAMEYISGADLGFVLAGYQEDTEFISPEDAGRIIRQVCLALDYAHSRGVIHRDVKPSNIMLDKQGHAFLTDFGLALLDDKTQGEIFGTPDYIAPEQAISSAGAVPQSDLYAVGVILYEMFTNKLPFSATHPHDVAMLHLSEPPPPPCDVNPDLSPEVDAVILKALAKEPGERYPSGLALADALDQALAAAPAAGASSPSAAADQPLPPIPAAIAAPGRRQVKKEEPMTLRYIMTNIRTLLTELSKGYTEEELRQICFDLPDFGPVQHQLSRIGDKAEIVERLLEYAEQTLQLEKVLTLARAYKPALYEKYQPYYELIDAGKVDLIGSNLGKYHIVERIGQGGMADVYKAYQPGLARYVAIKMIHGHLSDGEEFMERFEREALAVSGLRHPNIVQVFDFDREEERCYMVMEFIAGSSLKARLKERQARGQAFDLGETVSIFSPLASAIDYAHSRGMIHRDLKPGNIMFTPQGRVVLTDFGIAHMASIPSFTLTNSIVGTPAYMSPEQAEGKPVDSWSDIYALGVILYELVTGRIPFEGDNPFAIMMALTNGAWLPPTSVNPNLPRSVERVILKAMSKNPAERYQSAGEMAQVLQATVELPADEIRLPASPESNQNPQLDATLPLPGEGEQSHQPRALQKAELPEVKVSAPLSEPKDQGLSNQPGDPGRAVTISSNTGQVAFGGDHVVQIGNISGGQVSLELGNVPIQPPEEASEINLIELQQILLNLKARVETEAEPAKRDAALERLAELEEAITAAEPDLDTIAYVQGWFVKNIPELARPVTDLITHPIVNKLMILAGDSAAAEFQRRFGLY